MYWNQLTSDASAEFRRTESRGRELIETMEKERRLSGSRVVHLVRRSSDRHPTGGLKLGRCIDTFVFEIVKNSSAESAGLLVGDLVIEVGPQRYD